MKRQQYWLGLLVVFCCWWLAWPSMAQTTAWTLASSQPNDPAKAIPVDQEIRLVFDQPLPAAVQELNLDLQPSQAIGFDIQGTALVLKPDPAWRYSTTYTLTLPSQPSLPLTQPVSLTFRTAPEFTYVANIAPLLRTSCVGCHQIQGRQRNKLLDTYAGVMRFVKPGDAKSPLLLPRWTGRHARVLRTRTNPDGTVVPTGGSPEVAFALRNGIPLNKLGFWTPEEIAIVRTWVIQDLAAEQ